MMAGDGWFYKTSWGLSYPDLFKMLSLSKEHVEPKLVAGIALCLLASVFFGISVPRIFLTGCSDFTFDAVRCTIPAESHDVEITMAVFGIALAIVGLGFVALNHLERSPTKHVSD